MSNMGLFWLMLGISVKTYCGVASTVVHEDDQGLKVEASRISVS